MLSGVYERTTPPCFIFNLIGSAKFPSSKLEYPFDLLDPSLIGIGLPMNGLSYGVADLEPLTCEVRVSLIRTKSGRSAASDIAMIPTPYSATE